MKLGLYQVDDFIRIDMFSNWKNLANTIVHIWQETYSSSLSGSWIERQLWEEVLITFILR